ncbi:MAG: ATP-binding protein [Sphingomicrobium sp.]
MYHLTINRRDPGPVTDDGAIMRFRTVAATIAGVAGALTLTGLTSGVDILTRWAPSSTSMNPITAAMLILGSIALLLPRRCQAVGGPLLAAGLIATGAAKVAQIALGRPLGVDQIVSLALHRAASVVPDPVAPNTAVALILLGLALALGRARQPARALAAQSLCALAMSIALFALIGFALGAATINEFTFNRMAVNTAVGLLALGLGIMTLTPAHGVMQLLVHDSPAGNLARKALPICLLLPPLLGTVRLWMQSNEAISTGDGVVIMVAGNILLSLVLLWGCLIMLLRNEDELRANALAIAKSEEQYRVAEHVSRTGHWQYEAASRSLLWSAEFRSTLRLAGQRRATFRAMVALIHPDDAPAARRLVRDALRSGTGWNSQLRLRYPDGSIQHVRSHGVVTRAPSGQLISLFGVIADITELELARQASEAASHAQAAFLANMSHEIRTPLNGVMGFIDLLLDSKLDPVQRRHLSLVNESAHSLLRLLNDILDLSKVEAGHMEIAAQPTDIRRTMRHAVRLMAPVAEQKKIALSVAVDPDFPAAVMVDGARFRQILLNILGNALKFTERGSVVVTLRRQLDGAGADRFTLIVTDSGVGIPADRKDAEFSPFVQADNSTSRRFGGSGLGLAISRQLANRMGGKIELDSEQHVGTTVTLTLPLDATDADPELGDDDADGWPDHPAPASTDFLAISKADRPLAVLLVEDIELNRELVTTMLGRLGHRVDLAANGAEAVALAGRLAVQPDAWDLILMDVQMPVMNGWEATARIRALGGAASAIPIVALSANAFDAEIERSRASGMDDHVVKPVAFKQLERVVECWGRAADRVDGAARSRAASEPSTAPATLSLVGKPTERRSGSR